jgi:hypothetical protein
MPAIRRVTILKQVIYSKPNYFMRKIRIAALLLLMATVFSCNEDDQVIDPTPQIVGSWKLIDAKSAKPVPLIYTFESSGEFYSRGIPQTSNVDGTWRFTNTGQTELEILFYFTAAVVFDVDELTETTLRIKSDAGLQMEFRKL